MSEALEILKSCDAFLEGHFLLSSGRHSGAYCQMAYLQQYPDRCAEVMKAVADKVKEMDVDVIVGPAMGGIVYAYELARQTGKRAIFTERVDNVMTLKRFAIHPGEKCLIAEDVVTTGISSLETKRVIEEAGGGLVKVFRTLLTSRGGREYPVEEFRNYGDGGIGGIIEGVPVLLGTLDFMQDMDILIPEGTMVNQAVYAAIDGELSAVVAISYAKMRSSAAGLVSLSGCRRLTPVMLTRDFMLTETFLRSKFSVNTRKMVFPDQQTRDALGAVSADPEADVLALTTRQDLAAFVYAVTGSGSLRTASRLGVAIHLLGGIVGLVIMAAIAYLGSTQLLAPINIFLYQLVWMIPGLLITEWTRSV